MYHNIPNLWVGDLGRRGIDEVSCFVCVRVGERGWGWGEACGGAGMQFVKYAKATLHKLVA